MGDGGPLPADDRPDTPEGHVKLRTRALRSSGDVEYVRLRQVLREHEVDPDRAILLDYLDDGGAFYGILLTPRGQFVEFDVFYVYEPERWQAGHPVCWSGEVRWDVVSPERATLPPAYVTAAKALLDSAY